MVNDGGPERQVTLDSEGNWTANFSPYNLVPGADNQPLLNLNRSIGGGYPFALVQASLRYFTSQSLYLVFGFKYQQDFVEYLSSSAWASHEVE